MELSQLVIGIARMGYRGSIPERCLSSLLAYAKEHGLKEVLSWIQEDTGYLAIPSWQFLLPWQIVGPSGRLPRVRAKSTQLGTSFA